VTSKVLIERLNGMGEYVKSASSTVEPPWFGATTRSSPPRCRGTCCPGSTCCRSGASGPGSPFGTGCGDACSGSPRSRCACPVGTGSRRPSAPAPAAPAAPAAATPAPAAPAPAAPSAPAPAAPAPPRLRRPLRHRQPRPLPGRPRGWLRPGCTASRRALVRHPAPGQQPVRAEPGHGPHPREGRPPRQQPLRPEPGYAPAAEPSGRSSPRWRRCRCRRSASRWPAPQPRHDARPSSVGRPGERPARGAGRPGAPGGAGARPGSVVGGFAGVPVAPVASAAAPVVAAAPRVPSAAAAVAPVVAASPSARSAKEFEQMQAPTIGGVSVPRGDGTTIIRVRRARA
jgi:translation initiation factor IF-2